MMRRIGVISCTKRKKGYKCMARLMYSASPLFRKAYDYARRNYDLVLILSANYGVLRPLKVIDPYDKTLHKMSKPQRLAWADQVFPQLMDFLRSNDELFFHAGALYREHLIPRLEKAGFACHVPLEHLQLGEQLRWYNKRR